MCNMCRKIAGIFLFLVVIITMFNLGYVEDNFFSVMVVSVLTFCIFERVLRWFGINRTFQELLLPATLLILGMVSFNIAGQMAALKELTGCGVLVSMGVILMFLTVSTLRRN